MNASAIPKTKPRCPICGAAVTSGSSYCVGCVPLVNRDNLLLQAKLGRIATHSAIAEARRSATQAKQAQALRKWNPSHMPGWLDEDTYRRDILPLLNSAAPEHLRERASEFVEGFNSLVPYRGQGTPRQHFQGEDLLEKMARFLPDLLEVQAKPASSGN